MNETDDIIKLIEDNIARELRMIELLRRRKFHDLNKEKMGEYINGVPAQYCYE